MRTIFFSTLFVLFSLVGVAQNIKVVLSKAKYGAKQEAFDVFQVQYKVVSGHIGIERYNVCLVENNRIVTYGYIESSEEVRQGQTTKYDHYLYLIGKQAKEGMTLVSYDLLPTNLPTNRTFSFKTQQAFLGSSDKEFFAGIDNLKGTLKVGDMIEYINFKGEKGKAKITELQIEGMRPPILVDGLPADVSMSINIISESKADFTKATVGLVGSMSNVATTPMSAKTDSKAKTKTIPVNAIFENNEVKITIHNLVKFNPDPADNQYDIMKVDYDLDYYIVDATIENKSQKPIDGGEYLLRLNFFDKDGKSADEFLRTFKSDSNKDDAKDRADKVDVNVFGGTSKIRLSQVMVKYQNLFPDYDTQYKPNVDAMMQPIQPKQKIRSEMATLMGIPPSYKIEGIGTWSGTFYSKKNLLFTPVKM